MKSAPCLIVVATVLLAAGSSRAQGADPAAAQALFDQAKQLVAKGRLAEACPKFVASFRLDPKPGTAVNLADCLEKNGQLASAWARYLEAATLSQRSGQAEREQYAKEHAAALEPRLSRLTVSAPTAPRGLEVLRDGTAVDAAILGTAVPVDPGKHLIEARAPGKKPWASTIEVTPGAAALVVQVPALEDAPAGAAGSAVPPGPSPTAPSRRPVGFAALGLGAGGLVAGAITGGLAVKKHGDLAAVCNGQGGCTNQQGGIDAYHLLGTVADVGFVVGGALALTGVVLVATAPKEGAAKTARVVPVVGPGFAGVAGRF